jgi:hypothetical protein
MSTTCTRSGPIASAAIVAVSGPGQVGQFPPPDGDHRAVPRVDGRVGGARGRAGLGQVQVGDDQRLLELRAPGEQLAGGVHDDRVAVEHQLVLAAHHVHVGQGGTCLPGPALA